MANAIDMDSAVRTLEMYLESYYQRRQNEGEEIADGVTMQFAGAKGMLEALGGTQAKAEALRRLRAKNLKIPHCGDRAPDGSGYMGMDFDADLGFLKSKTPAPLAVWRGAKLSNRPSRSARHRPETAGEGAGTGDTPGFRR